MIREGELIASPSTATYVSFRHPDLGGLVPAPENTLKRMDSWVQIPWTVVFSRVDRGGP